MAVIIIIALCCSGVAFVYHYSKIGSQINVKILGFPNVVVEGAPIHLTSNLTGYHGLLSYHWCINSTFYSSSRFTNITFYTPGIHVITLSVDSINGDSGSDIIFIHVLPRLNVLLSSNLSKVIPNENVSIYSQVIGGFGPYYYSWYSNGNLIRTGFNLSQISYSFDNFGNYNIGLIVNNSEGYFGSSSFNFDPWNFSELVDPQVRQGFGFSNSMADDQMSVVSGNLIFHFLVYNPNSVSGINNITVYLYNILPPKGPSSIPIFNFTFSTGVVSKMGGEWINVNPQIFWNYSSLVVIPQSQTGTTGNQIGIANPQNFNSIFSHYWVPPWDSSDDGFIGYWTESNNITITVN